MIVRLTFRSTFPQSEYYAETEAAPNQQLYFTWQWIATFQDTVYPEDTFRSQYQIRRLEAPTETLMMVATRFPR
jgi:hypothetical protein